MQDCKQSRGPNLYIQTTLAKSGEPCKIGLQQYIHEKGILNEELVQEIKKRLYNYRHRNNHRRAQLTQKEITFLDNQIASAGRYLKWSHTEGPAVLEKLRTEESKPEPTYNLITITDHLELLIGKTIKHETFPIEGTIIAINNEIIEIDFNGKIVEIELSETNGLLIQTTI